MSALQETAAALAGAPILILLVGLCLAVEAFFSGTEVAFVSVDRSRIRRRAEAGSLPARHLQRLMERPERVLSTTLIGTNLSVVTASFLANELFARRFGQVASAWAIALMVPLILLFGEILPKTISRRHPEAVALRLVLPLRLAMIVLSPLLLLTSWVARLVTRPFRARAGRQPFVTKEELRLILHSDRRLALEKDEASLIKRLLDFADARASEHMTPLVDVVSIPDRASPADAVRVIHERGFSRIPVTTGRVDNITGLVEAMDLIGAPAAGADLAPYLRRPMYVPETARIDRLLDEMKKNHQEMAVVVDEYGSATGVLTLEDIIEEIVGDVLDEFDRPGKSGLERTAEGAFLVEGKCRLDDLEEALGLSLPRAGYETASGLAAHLFQKVPRAGETMVHGGVRLTVLDATQRTVRRMKVEKIEAAAGGPA